ncbi:MAG: alpha/beta fold hydrolase [Clostridium sp.]|nr:alpha/beta fold hydrolase [Acetatifactor muris]MCM1525894.1 alpha/beta fold hydrolase [Bacteroides sp.]MCM1562566.1 alpha/beta fold hydrolase [Clostridium sp.]
MKKTVLSLLIFCMVVMSCPQQVYAAETDEESMMSTEPAEFVEESVPSAEEAREESFSSGEGMSLFSLERAEEEQVCGEDDLLLYGDAVRLEEGIIELTELATWRAGSIWYGHQISARNGFTVTFSYWAGGGRHTGPYYGADGILLTMSKEPGLGPQGGYLGFVGQDAYGVELDSYHNAGDPDGRHVAIVQGSVQKHLDYVIDNRVDDSGDVSGSGWHTLSVRYEHSVLKVSLDGEELLSCGEILLPDEIYLGISAATGGGMNRHLIKDFDIEGLVSEGKSFEVDEHPIIIVPGIMGSRLFVSNQTYDQTNQVWDPPLDWSDPVNSIKTLYRIERINNRMAPENQLYVPPCKNQNSLSIGDREYGTQGVYKVIVNELCNAFPDREIYFFSYDWRKSNGDSADKLNSFIDELDADKVDLLCHSMGGLVVSSYYAKYADKDRVDKIITCGTPYEGAPALINSVQNWDVLGEGITVNTNTFYDFVLGAAGGMTKELKTSFQGVVELTPSQNYVNHPKTQMWKDSVWPVGIADRKMSYEEYVETCKRIFGDQNYRNAQVFQNSLLTQGYTGNFNLLRNYENAYFVIGTNQKTITAIKFQFTNDDVDQRLYESDLKYDILGDGTVPYLSATIMKQVENRHDNHWETFSTNHMGTVQDPACVSWVTDILRYGSSDVTGAAPQATPYTVIRVACPVDVTVSDGAEALCSAAENLNIASSFGRLDILGAEDEIKMLCLDPEDMDVLLQGTGTGVMDYTIRFFDEEDNLTDERTFEGVPVTADTVMHTRTGRGETTVLEIDEDGDGIINLTWEAAANERISASGSEDSDEVESPAAPEGNPIESESPVTPERNPVESESPVPSEEIPAGNTSSGSVSSDNGGTETGKRPTQSSSENTGETNTGETTNENTWANDTPWINGAQDSDLEEESFEDEEESAVELLRQTILCRDCITKRVGDGDFLLNARNGNNPQARLLYTSSDVRVVTVSEKGRVSIKGAGMAVIRIVAPAVDGQFEETVREVTIVVQPKDRTAFWRWLYYILRKFR